MTALLASDLDGTLIHHEGVYRPEGFVDPADVAAVKAWREAGNLFVPASGRSVGNVRHGLAGTGLHGDHIVCHTGAVVTDSALHPVPGLTRALDPEIVQGLCDLLIGRDGVTVLATTTDEDLVLPDGRTGLPTTSPSLRRRSPSARSSPCRYTFPMPGPRRGWPMRWRSGGRAASTCPAP